MPNSLTNPPREFSLMPFWFWNDELSTDEILRQIDDFERHGVFGFVIHPRVGLPRDCGWMSERLLGFMGTAIDEAARREMKVILYDEGMYPSGSSSGQVVAKWPDLACRCLALHDIGLPLPRGANPVHEIEHAGTRRLVIDRPADSFIRGLHYIGEGPAEDEPPAGDILNPRTADAVIALVYDVFAKQFGRHFGQTVLGIFTDEPSPLGRCREKNVVPGTEGILAEVERLVGFDFTPHLHHLWSDAEEAARWKEAWHSAIRLRLNETWYRPLSHWCESHGIALCGHPDRGDEIGVQRYFHMPGQDLVWRWVEPGKATGITGHESTQGKCTSSAMIHLGRRRNSNEFAGAWGAQTTFEEVRALANWCLVRGVNLLIPHAFYYSIRGPRKDERPPQIGPHTPQWESGEFACFADGCRRLCWLNTDSRHICNTAILTDGDRCPWQAAAALLTHQCDFNYLEPETLLRSGHVDEDGVKLSGMHYALIIIDGNASDIVRQKLQPAATAGRVIDWSNAARLSAEELMHLINARVTMPVQVHTDSRALRVRQVEKDGFTYAILFNEGDAPASMRVTAKGPLEWVDLATGHIMGRHAGELVHLSPFELRLARLS